MMHRKPEGKHQFKRIASEFDAWLVREKLSQAEIGNRLGVSQSAISRVIRGQTENPQLLHKLCAFAGIDVHKKDPSYSEALSAALHEVWDGTDEGGRDIAQLLYAAVRVGKAVP